MQRRVTLGANGAGMARGARSGRRTPWEVCLFCIRVRGNRDCG